MEIEVQLLAAIARYQDRHDAGVPERELEAWSRLETADFLRLLYYLRDCGLVTWSDAPDARWRRGERKVWLTPEGRAELLVEQLLTRRLPPPGPRLRPSPLAGRLEPGPPARWPSPCVKRSAPRDDG